MSPPSPGVRASTASADETRSAAERLGALLRPGDVVSLTGDLGAGKTTFVQGAARGLGAAEPVVSPTFTLIREYRGRLPIYHLDVYRLERIQDVVDLGFEELVDRGGVVFIEWGDAIEPLLPPSRLQVELTTEEDDRRLLALSWQGGAWSARAEHLAAALAPWEV